jgi:hypothetical protein
MDNALTAKVLSPVARTNCLNCRVVTGALTVARWNIASSESCLSDPVRDMALGMDTIYGAADSWGRSTIAILSFIALLKKRPP